MITTIKAYKTSDGNVHKTELAARKAEFFIEMRSYVNNKLNPQQRSAYQNDPATFANIIVSDFNGFIKFVRQHYRAIARAEKNSADA